MADTVTSPNMNMPVPVVSVAPGPDWASYINACLGIIDGHTHTPGSGVPITPNALDINADLPLNGNNLISVRSTRYQSQVSLLSQPSDLGCVYVSGVDLYYNDGSGNQIRLTQSGAPAGATGTITGLPSGTASASFAGGTFAFQSATNTPAFLNVGPVTIGRNLPGVFNVTLTPSSSQASNYGLTFPQALPTAQSYVTSDSSGNLSFLYNGANVRGLEGSGTTTLVSSDNFVQVFDLSADRTCVLPSTGITAGQRITIYNRENFLLTVQSSNGSAMTLANGANVNGNIYSGSAVYIALQNSPSTPAHWYVSDAIGSGLYTSTVTNVSFNSVPANFSAYWSRKDSFVTVGGRFTANASGGNRRFQFSLPIAGNNSGFFYGHATAQAGTGAGVIDDFPSSTVLQVNCNGDTNNELYAVTGTYILP